MKTIQIRDFNFEFRELTQEEYIELTIAFAGYSEYFSEQSNEEKATFLLSFVLGLLTPDHDLTLDELLTVAGDVFSNYPDVLKMVEIDRTIEQTLTEARNETTN